MYEWSTSSDRAECATTSLQRKMCIRDRRSCGAKIDQMDISSLDPQTAEKLTEMKEQLVSICDLTQQKLTLSADQLDRLIARVVEIDKSAQSKMSSTNEGIASTKKGMLGGKR